MTQTSEAERVNAYLLNLFGDPFAEVFDACASHRAEHGPDCGVYPAAAPKMRVLSTLLKAINARRVLEIGGGIGYSALWLAQAVGENGRVQTIERDPTHVALIERYAAQFGLSEELAAITGEGIDVLTTLTGPYDAIHDDGWFADEPAYYDRMVELLRPGGLLILANCFLLEDAVGGNPRMDWSVFAGEQWAEHMLSYAQKLAADPRLEASFIMRPAWVGLAYKRLDA